MAVGLAVGVLTAVGGRAIWQGRQQVSSPAMRVTSLTGFHGYEMMPTLSPDGEQVAFAGNSDTENVDIHVTIIGSHTARRITTDPAIEYFPSWSPDGKQIAFIRRVDDESGHVYLTTPLGGGERRLSDFPVSFDGYGAFGQISWSPDGRSIAAAPAYPLREGYRSTGIYLLPLRGGDPRLLTHASAPATHRDPAFSPDGRQLAYFACDSCCYAKCDLMIVDADTERAQSHPPRRLTSMDTQMFGLAWAPDGESLVYGTENSSDTYLWRVDFDGSRPPERLEIAGAAARRPAAVPSHDRLVFARAQYDADIYRVDTSGAARPVIVSSFPEGDPSYSPDGRRIAFSRAHDTAEVWVAGADGSGAQQLTHEIGPMQWCPRWAPNSQTIAFSSVGDDGHWHVWTIDADGANLRQITTSADDQQAPRWSRDGRSIYFSKNTGQSANVWRVSVASRREEPITRSGGDWAQESMDGKSLIYMRKPQQAGAPLLMVSLTGGSPRQLAPCVYGFSVEAAGIYYYPCRPAPAGFSLARFLALTHRVAMYSIAMHDVRSAEGPPRSLAAVRRREDARAWVCDRRGAAGGKRCAH